MMKTLVLSALAISMMATGAHAASFAFVETFDNGRDFASGGVELPITVSGTFDGDLSGTVINNLGNIAVYLNGVAFNGNNALLAYRFDTVAGTWAPGGATISLDGTADNFLFTDKDLAAASNFYHHVTFSGQSVAADRVAGDELHGLYGYTMFGQRRTLTVTPVQSGVPEPATWAMMVIGFGMMGATHRRRRVTPVRS